MAINKIRRVLIDIMLDIDPDLYGPYVIMDRKVFKQLIVQCQNAIYGIITASLLYYKNSRNSLEDEGYEFNPYYPCVANNNIKVSQMTVCFHLDDLKLINKIPKVVGKTITWLKQECESIFEDGSG